jgi:sulfatase modifying factor 1
MKRSHLVAALFAVFTLNSSLQAALITIDWVTVGDAGNSSDGDFGAVAYEYKIGKYEVTIGQYTTFLNSVASVTSDSYIVNLWNANMTSNLNIAGISRSGSGIESSPYSYSVIGSGNRPISYVNWFGAARFANWMNNGGTNGASTEAGAYTLNGASSGVGFTKNAGATWWIPSADEWYKAAYYKGGSTNAGYWDYATQSDTAPGNTISGAANRANYKKDGVYSLTQSASYDPSQMYLASVGTFDSPSAYGTYDQAGSLREWNDGIPRAGSRFLFGGSWGSPNVNMNSIGLDDPIQTRPETGFRLATAIPEPGTYALMALAGAVLVARVVVRRRRS